MPETNTTDTGRWNGLNVNVGDIALAIFQSASLILFLGLLGIVYPFLDSQLIKSNLKPPPEATDEQKLEAEAILQKKLEDKELIYNLLVNTGVALFASGIIILLIESRNRGQSAQDAEEFKKTIEDIFTNKIRELEIAEQDSIIYSLVQNKNVFHELKNNILRQDFILRDHTTLLSMEWVQINGNEYLKVAATTHYFAENLTDFEKSFEVTLNLSSDNPEHILNIDNYYVSLKASRGELVNKQNRLQEVQEKINEMRAESNGLRIGFKDAIPIAGRAQNFIELGYSSISIRGSIPLILPRIADGMRVKIVDCPDDITIRGYPFHSGGSSFTSPNKSSNVSEQVWTINAGVLPYQGIYLFWSKN